MRCNFTYMKNRLTLLISILLLALPVKLLPQESPNFHFKKIGVENGLSESTIYTILQDSKGFMWFGTKDGLNRFDGNSFRIFRNDSNKKNSIGNNFIRSIAQINDSTLYVGTDAGLYIMNTNDETFDRFDTQTSDGTEIVSAINALFVDKNGNIWIGTMLQEVFIYNPQAKKLNKVEILKYNLNQNATWIIYEDKSGTIWIGTRLGLLRYNKHIEKLEAIENMFGVSDNPNNEILTILEDNNGNLWLGTWADGLRKYNKQTNEYRSFLNSGNNYVTHIRTLLPYSSHSLLVGSDDGLYLFDIETYKSQRLDIPQLEHSLSDQNVYSMAKDKEGGLWIGTYFGGINYLNLSLSNIETYRPNNTLNSLSGKAISQFCEDKNGNLWIATEDGGINYLDTRTKQITQPVKTSYHNTHALLLDGDDLWIGTFSRGIDIYNTKTKQTSNFRCIIEDENTINDDCIFSLYKTKDGEIYVGTPIGLNKYDKKTKRFLRISEVNGFIYDMKEDDYGNLWIAAYGEGVMKLDPETKQWIHYDKIYDPKDPIVGSKLTGIYIDSQKRLLFSSEGRGIFIYDYKTDRFKNISEADGLPNNVIYGILDDPFGNLWLSCNKGLVCLNDTNPKDYKLYNQEDGLQSNQFNFKASYKAKNGKLYFGGINGFNCFYPQDLSERENPIIPPIEITKIQLLGNNDTEITQEIKTNLNKKKAIELPYDKASFNISYISLSYISQTKNQYAYQLLGVDNDWNYVENNKSVTYVNLPPGEYTFQVKASNNDGLWNEKGTAIKIKILPPFWLSTPAKILYSILFIALLYFIINYYQKKNKKKQAYYLEAYKTEQETLAFKSKIEFFTTIAHEIRTPLSLINAPLEEIITSGDGKENTKQNLLIIEKNCDRLTVLINQLLDFRKMDSTMYIVNPEKIDLKRYITELYERFKKTAQKKNVDFQLILPENENSEVIFDTDALTKIVGNLLTNALKYTRNRIILSLKKNHDNKYVIIVEDNGRGISDEHKNLIFDPFYQVRSEDKNIGSGIGLSLVKHLAEAVNGNIEVRDAEEKGTAFIFTFSDISQELINRGIAKEETQNEEIEQSNKDSKNSILVVDDNLEIISFLKNSLQSEYLIDTAISVTEAFELLEGERLYDLIISDIMMPDIDGIEFTKKLKSDLNYSHIPVILLSAKTENITKIEGLRSGADVFIEKPFSILHLKAQISSLLENRKALLEAFNRTPFSSYTSLTTNKRDEQFFKKLDDEIEKHIANENFSVESLTDILGMSRSNLQRKLKSICGVTPGDYLRNYRLKKACKLLLENDLRINEVAFQVGFSSASYFTKVFIKCYNMSPKEFISKYTK